MIVIINRVEKISIKDTLACLTHDPVDNTIMVIITPEHYHQQDFFFVDTHTFIISLSDNSVSIVKDLIDNSFTY